MKKIQLGFSLEFDPFFVQLPVSSISICLLFRSFETDNRVFYRNYVIHFKSYTIYCFCNRFSEIYFFVSAEIGLSNNGIQFYGNTFREIWFLLQFITQFFYLTNE